MRGGGGRKRNTESVLPAPVSEDVGNIRICGVGTVSGPDAANITIVVIVGTQSGTANGKH